MIRVEPLERKLPAGGCADRREGLAKGLLSKEEDSLLEEAEQAVARVVAVDDFAAEEPGETNFSPSTGPKEERKKP